MNKIKNKRKTIKRKMSRRYERKNINHEVKVRKTCKKNKETLAWRIKESVRTENKREISTFLK